jgi:glycosyltransferase involved in cell wall biosynthesis
MIAAYGLTEKVQLLDPCPYDEVISAANQYDAGLDVTPEYQCGVRHLNNVYGLPNKLFSYAAAGLALVLPDYYVSVRRLLKDSASVLWFSEKDPRQITAVLRSLIEHPERVAALKTAAHRWSLNHTEATEFAKLRSIYTEL